MNSSIPRLNEWSVFRFGVEIFPNRRENFDDYRILNGECTVFGVGGDTPTVPRTAVVDLVVDEQSSSAGYQISGLLVRVVVRWDASPLFHLSAGHQGSLAKNQSFLPDAFYGGSVPFVAVFTEHGITLYIYRHAC